MENKTKKFFLESIWQDIDANAMGEIVLTINLREGSFRAITTINHCPICESRFIHGERLYKMGAKFVCEDCCDFLQSAKPL